VLWPPLNQVSQSDRQTERQTGSSPSTTLLTCQLLAIEMSAQLAVVAIASLLQQLLLLLLLLLLQL